MSNFSKKDRQGFLIIGVVVALVALAFVFVYNKSNAPKLDARSCGPEIANATVILIDRSDDTPRQTLDEIISRTKRFVFQRAQEGELVSLFEISRASRADLKPVFSACVPKRDGSDLYENRKKIQRKFAEEFEQPLDAALSGAPIKSDISPISEVISDLSASEYLAAKSNRLIVFSDLLQNSENTSLYQCRLARSAIKEFRDNRSGAIERPEFHNTAVELHVIPREGLATATVKCRDGFWAWFFGNNDGPEAGLTMQMLPGGAKIS